jgi:membrane glycosyltransferase
VPFGKGMLLWMSPVIVAVGISARRLGLLVTPEELIPPDVVRRANELATGLHPVEPRSRLWEELLIGPTLSKRHREMLPQAASQRFGEVNIDLVVGISKLNQCSLLEDAFKILSKKELKELLGDRKAFDQLKALGRREQSRGGAAGDILTIS